MNRYPGPSALSVLCCAAALALSGASFAQNGSASRADAGPGDCTPSAEAHECAERCPSFDTCLVETGGGRLYYRIADQRFDCEGLECGAASQALGDYCCERGAFAPDKGGGGGCALAVPPGAAPAAWLAIAALLASAALRRRPRAR